MKLQERQWIEFRIGDFFIVERGKRIVKDVDFFTRKNEEYFYPVITASSSNNSVSGYYNKYNCNKNTIVCCGEVNGFFATFQEEKCWVLDTNRIFIPKDNLTINKYIAFFLITIFKKEMFKYSYGRKARPKHIINTLIKLPIDNNGEPDWKFMEDYIKEIWGGVFRNINSLF